MRFTIVLSGLVALGIGCVEKDESEVPELPSRTELDGSSRVMVNLGDVVEIEPPLPHSARSSYDERRLPVLQSGQSAMFVVTAAAGELVHAAIVPHGSGGDADLYLYNSAWALRGSSARTSEYVDRVFYTPVGYSGLGQFNVRVRCYRGPCSTHTLLLSRGDDQRFQTAAPALAYINQRSFPGDSSEDQSKIRCMFEGRVVRWGECACAAASAADAMASLGRIEIANGREAVADLFAHANRASDGAAVSADLRHRLESEYGLSCAEIRTNVYRNLKHYLRRGAVVLYRGGFTTSGHYVRPIGYGFDGTAETVILDDPYGRTAPPGWSLRNTTRIGDTAGFRHEIRWSAIYSAPRGDSLIVCE